MPQSFSLPLQSYLVDALNGISVRFESSGSAFASQAVDYTSLDFKPRFPNTIVQGPYGPEAVQPGMNVRLLQQGGGMQSIDVGFWARRYGRGDAEYWLYNFMKRLGRTGISELVVDGIAYTNVYFVGGDGAITPTWYRHPDGVPLSQSNRLESAKVQGTLRFVRSIPGSSGSVSAPTNAPPQEFPAYGLGSNRGDYTATSGVGGVVKLGRFCDLVRVSVDRPAYYSVIPRCYGVRIKGQGHTNSAIATGIDYRRGRRLRLQLRGYVRASETDMGVPDPIPNTYPGFFYEARARLQERVGQLEFKLRDIVWNLAGNGNFFSQAHLSSFDVENDDQAYQTWPFNASFEVNDHEVNAA